MILNNANLVTFWGNQPVVEGALVAIEGKSVVDFGKVGKLVDRYDDSEVLDVAGRLVLPGMIDGHTRFDRSLLVGRSSGPLEPARIEKALDPETLYWSALVSLLDSVRSGVTTVFGWIPSVGGGVEAIDRAFEEVRLRGSLACSVSSGSYSRTAIEENVRRIQGSRGSALEWRRGLFGLDATSALDDETVAAAVAAAEPLAAGFHVLLGERGGAARLLEAGVWRHGGLAVAPGEISQDDAKALRHQNVYLVHTAQSGAFSGAPPLDFRKAGVKLGLGTDGIGLGLLEEFRVACLRQRSVPGAERELDSSLRLSYHAAFVVNPDLATAAFGPDLGRIKPGARADLVVLDYRPSTPLDERSAAEHLLFGAMRAPVESLIVKGRLVYHNRQFVGLDEERIRARAREASTKFWERL